LRSMTTLALLVADITVGIIFRSYRGFIIRGATLYYKDRKK